MEYSHAEEWKQTPLSLFMQESAKNKDLNIRPHN